MADFFSKFKKTFDKGVNTVSIKSNTLVEINKVKGAIHTLNTNIQQQKNELSNTFYKMYLEDEIDVEACKGFCRNIQELEVEIKEKEKEIESIKAKEEVLLAEANRKIEEKQELKAEVYTPNVQVNKEESAQEEGTVENKEVQEEVAIVEEVEVVKEVEVVEEATVIEEDEVIKSEK